jgi:hypothetical protein
VQTSGFQPGHADYSVLAELKKTGAYATGKGQFAHGQITTFAGYLDKFQQDVVAGLGNDGIMALTHLFAVVLKAFADGRQT